MVLNYILVGCPCLKLKMMAVDHSIKVRLVFSAHAVKMVSSDVRIIGAVARQTGLRAVHIETNGLASAGVC